MTFDALEEKLLHSSTRAHAAWKPEIFPAGELPARERLAHLLAREPNLAIIDTLPTQLADLARVRKKRKQLAAADLAAEIDLVLEGSPLHEFGNWVHFPWRHQLVRLLPEAPFRQLRWDRNQYKIAADEQRLLASKTILVVGLSVGRTALLNLVQEGIGTHFRLCDFDHLDISNLNRLRGSVADIGVNKVVLAAREVFEQDPYLDVAIYPQGASADNLEEVFPATVDLLVEECDDLCMKLWLRERARALRVPVIMETSDRGMLDIERFDREPERPVFHGLVADLEARSLQGLTTRQRVPFVLRILDTERLSVRLSSSLAEVEESISTWPQLASSVSLGGALVCDAARRILLGTHQVSGRYYVDLDELLREDARAALPLGSPIEVGIAAEALQARTLPEKPARSLAADSGALHRYLVGHAIWAPSGGNQQPWRFHSHRDGLDCLRSTEGAASFLDFAGWGELLALGAAVENICLAAPSVGLHARVIETTADPMRVAHIALSRGEHAELPLRAQIPRRVTHRHVIAGQLLDPSTQQDLVRSAEAHGLVCRVVQDPAGVAALGRTLGELDRLRALIEPYHRELFDELRWTPEDVCATRTGIDLCSLELQEADRAGLAVLRRWPVAEFMRRHGLGAGLRHAAVKALAGCAGVTLLSAPSGWSPFECGRRLQRFWLEATALGLAFQPWLPGLAMLARAEHGLGLTPDDAAAIRGHGTQLRALWQLPGGFAPLFVGRTLVAAPEPSARSLRLPVERVLVSA
ncbi:MAG: Rv1355c family protein [Polyangiales bacterium]